MGTSGPISVVSVGRLYADLIFSDVPRLPTMGTEVFAGGIGLFPGGGAFITAAHLVAVGRPTALAAILPAPPFGPVLEEALSASGVDVSLLSRSSGDPQVTVALTGGGERAFVTHKSGPPAPQITVSDVKALRATHLHIGELTTLMEMPELLRMAREAGMTVSLDCGWDDLLTADRAAPLIAEVDVFLPNEIEAARLASLGVRAGLAPLTIVKRGAQGATAQTWEEQFEATTTPVDAVDTTGAGDAFNAGFLHAWLQRSPIEICLAAGNVRARASIQRIGGFRADTAQDQSVTRSALG